MKSPPENFNPPPWAERFLEWYCRPELLEDLQGDLQEYFERNVKSKGYRYAKIIYIIDVFKFLRPYTLRKPEFLNLFIQWIMLSSYIKTSGRNLMRNKLFSFINIAGLAVSMSVGLVLIGVVSDVTSYDRFHKHHDRIVRVISQYEYLGKRDNNWTATTSFKVGKAMEESFSGIEAVAILRRNFGGDVTFEDKTIPLSGFWSNSGFFNVFSFELLKGNPKTALKEPFSIVLTQTSAHKLFGDEDVLGKVVILGHDQSYTITGVLKDVPHFSHFKFDMLGSIASLDVIANPHEDLMNWDNIWNTWVYALPEPQTDLQSIQSALQQLSLQEDPSVKNTHIELDLQPLNKVMVSDSMSNSIGPVLGSTLLWVFSGLTFVVLLSACFNYNNLSIARSLRRTREVGIRKVIGAQKNHVVAQFVVEAIVISLCALLVAVILFFMLRPSFLSLEPELQKLFTLQISPRLMIYFIGFSIAVGAAAGLFPALFFARIDVMKVLKNAFSEYKPTALSGRKVLMVIQYSLSIILICTSIGIYHQYRHFISFDLGFNTSNVLNIALQGNKPDIVKKEIGELAEVKLISKSSMITSVGSYWGASIKDPFAPKDTTFGVGTNYIDEHYLPLHEHTFLAGRNFTFKSDSATETEVIVNEEVLKILDIAERDPQKAIGEILTVGGNNLTIIGVLKDFKYGRANARLRNPGVIFQYQPQHYEWLNVKLESNDLLATYEKVEAKWKEIDPVHPINARFYDEQIDEAFSGLKATVKLAGFLAFLAICIASLGLLGMVVFTTEIRIKEISIRKVLGAEEWRLLFLLGKNFMVLLLIAASIGIPVTVLFFEKLVFTTVANSAPLNLMEMILGVVAIFSIALFMIIFQTMKVTRTNPAEVLKSE